MKLSIITINYNNLEGLKRTYDSVVAQTCQDFEWIIIDGGSTDGSKEFIEEHQEHFAYWCSESDKGIYNAMNKGIRRATGEYINFMNSGDGFYDSKSLSNFWDCYDKTIDVFYGDADFFDSKGNLFLHMALPDKIDYNFYLHGRNISHQASFIKSSLLRRHPYDESYKLAADGDMFFWLLLRRFKFKHINKILIKSDVPGLSGDENLARKEVERFIDFNIRNLPLIYKIRNKIINCLKAEWRIYCL